MAEAKLASVFAAGGRPDVVVVAPDLTGGLAQRAADGALTWYDRAYVDGDLAGAWLAVAATASGAVNAAVADEAERRRVWCVRADDAPRGSAALLAAQRHGPLLLAVSTSGRAPALARRIRQELAERYGPEYGAVADVMGELRRDPEVRAALAGLDAGERRARWRAVLDTDIVDLVRSGRRQQAKEVAAACLCSSSD